MNTLHCALENRADLYVNERQKIRRRKKKNAKSRFFTSRGAYYCTIIAMLYTHSIGNQP